MEMTNTPTQEEIAAALDELKNRLLTVEGISYWVQRHQKAIRYCIRAMADPEWKLVPKEPTYNLIIRMLEAQHFSFGENQRKFTLAAYRATLSAAPKYGETK